MRGRPGIKTVIVDRKESVTEKSRDTTAIPGAHLVTSLDVRIRVRRKLDLKLQLNQLAHKDSVLMAERQW
jgi:hypothetical protein